MRLCVWLLMLLLWLGPVLATSVQARTVSMNVARIETAIANLQEVNIRLEWSEDVPEGALSIQIGQLDAPMLGQRFERLEWRCSLRYGRDWQCGGPVRSDTQPPLHLTVNLSDAITEVRLADGPTQIRLHRHASIPDLTRIELTKVPLLWLQSWLAVLWPSAQLGRGQLDGDIQVIAADGEPLRVNTTFMLTDGALETSQGEIAAAGFGLQANVMARLDENEQRIETNASIRGGEALIGSAYLALPTTPVEVELRARKIGSEGWQLPHLIWRDGETLRAHGALGFSSDNALDHLNLHLDSVDISGWSERYLSGWLGLAGLGELQLGGALDMDVHLSADGLEHLEARFKEVNLDAQERFMLKDLSGYLIHSASGHHGGELTWQSGRLGEVAFGSAQWLMQSKDGLLQLTAPVEISTLNGSIRLDPFRLRLPHAGRGLQVDFGLYLQQLDLAPLSAALGWPAFRGQLTGVIPAARYIDGWLDLDGGLSMMIFDGRIDVTSLVMERPFGVAPTLTADLSLMNLDLMSITEVFDFGSISGRLDGQIGGLRLVDWRPTAFTAEFHTVPGRGARQRISQRAVRDISSVGGGGLMHSIQGRFLSVFKDFGYRRIGLGCRLLNEVCTMSGLHSADAGFTIVEGTGLPRLDVVGFNREVDWPTLLERLSQIADGASPVVQ